MVVTRTDSSSVSVPARAALAGNPSDGYRGAVVSVIVPGLSAEVRVDAALNPDSEGLLLAATRTRFTHEVGQAAQSGLRFDTNIPRSVGLAGSSAIVVGAIRCHARAVGAELEVDEIATMAHTVERVDLDIAGGWQDQIIQSRGESLLMDFAADRHVPLEPAPGIPLFVSWLAAGGESSGAAHATLAEDVASDAGRQRLMEELAELARAAAGALRQGDMHELRAAVDGTFARRRELMALRPEHVELVAAAHELGAAANYAGSGGAIAGVPPKNEASFVSGMERAGYAVRTWTTT